MSKIIVNMKLRNLILLLVLICVAGTQASAQSVGDCVFLQGAYVEVGIAPNGGFGSTLPAPSGYHSFLTTSQTFYDPGAGTSSSSTNFLGFVADYGRDGWGTGTPPYWGDYYLPGTPQEGWAVEVNGTRSEAYIPFYSSGTTGFSVGATLSGTNVGYTNSGGVMKGYWIGNQGNLRIRQTTILDTNKLYFTVNVIMTNTGGTTLNNIYYMRTLDPDNEVTRSGSYSTNNTITYRLPNPTNKVLVSAVGTGAYASNAYLGLGTKDCRAKSFIIDASLTPGTYTLSQIFSESTTFTYNLGGNLNSDVGVGLIYNIGSIAA
ncbi:MAG: hypothetical protein EBZ77_14145, partial [Chitinophagia bacterium]|nr:hypothetical protein [Chitinophagia bacterium]